MINKLSLLLQREVAIQNQHLYGDNLRGTATYDEAYHEGKRDAFLAVWKMLNGVVDIDERLEEVEEILITMNVEVPHNEQ